MLIAYKEWFGFLFDVLMVRLLDWSVIFLFAMFMRVFVYENIQYVWRAETSLIIGLLWLLLTTELFLIFIFHSGLLLHGITSCYCGNGDFCAVIGWLLF